MGMARRFFASPQEWALCGITALWGVTFLVVRTAMQESGPLWFVGLRLSVAAVILGLFSFPLFRDMTRKEVTGGAVLGVFLCAGFVLQTAGLATVTASVSAFITAFYVPLVPLFEWLLLRRTPGLKAWIGMALAFPGVVLITGGSAPPGGLGTGEILTILCAFVFALEIVMTGYIVPGTNPRRVATVQLIVGALLAFGCMPLLAEHPAPFSWLVVGSACGLGLASACIQSVVAWAQKRISPTRATIIYAGEPVWAGIVGYVVGERLSLAALGGCLLVITGILVSSTQTSRSES